MTAEVAILNRHAVALAADSAMTVPGDGGKKIYNTINKVFALSKHEPVGIMVYSLADICTVPIETVVKYYRSRILKDNQYDELKGYVYNFLSFLVNDTTLLTDAARTSSLGISAYRILETFERVVMEKETESRAKYAYDFAGRAREAIKRNGRCFGATPASCKEVKVSVRHVVDYWAGEAERKISVSQKLRVRLCNLITDALTRIGDVKLNGIPVRDIEIGVVIAGYGEKEAFPSLVSFELTSMAHGVLKFDMQESVKIDSAAPEKLADLVPFAQKDQIEAFMYGRPHDFDEEMAVVFYKTFTDQIDQIVSLVKGKVDDVIVRDFRAAIETLRNTTIDEFSKALVNRDKQEKDRLRTALANLPKENLAMIAEAVINLTIAKRRASKYAETVGPPVDVAVISKGDGFIWMKRKHYFDPELNPHFNRDYLRTN